MHLQRTLCTSALSFEALVLLLSARRMVVQREVSLPDRSYRDKGTFGRCLVQMGNHNKARAHCLSSDIRCIVLSLRFPLAHASSALLNAWAESVVQKGARVAGVIERACVAQARELRLSESQTIAIARLPLFRSVRSTRDEQYAIARSSTIMAWTIQQ